MIQKEGAKNGTYSKALKWRNWQLNVLEKSDFNPLAIMPVFPGQCETFSVQNTTAGITLVPLVQFSNLISPHQFEKVDLTNGM